MAKQKQKTKAELEAMDTPSLIYELLAERVGAVDPNQVLYTNQIKSGKDAGKWTLMVGGKKLTLNQAANLRAEANTLSQMEIWKLFTNTLGHEADLRMFKQAKTDRDLDWGKSILHAISIFETIVAAARAEHIEN